MNNMCITGLSPVSTGYEDMGAQSIYTLCWRAFRRRGRRENKEESLARGGRDVVSSGSWEKLVRIFPTFLPLLFFLLMTPRLLQSPRLFSRWAAAAVCGSGNGGGWKWKWKKVLLNTDTGIRIRVHRNKTQKRVIKVCCFFFRLACYKILFVF